MKWFLILALAILSLIGCYGYTYEPGCVVGWLCVILFLVGFYAWLSNEMRDVLNERG